MFSQQSTLAKNPVPALHDSCEKFLNWVQPLLSTEEFINTTEVVKKFIASDGEGEKLQAALIKQANNEQSAHWYCATWLELYLNGRYPLPINSNVFYYLKSKLDPHTFSQSQIAAALITVVLEFNQLIQNETLSVDRQKGQPLCMLQYKKLFSSTRIAQKQQDKLVISAKQKHIVVLYKANIFKLTVINEAGVSHSFLEIENALQQILQDDTKGENIGILTTQARDKWAEGRVELQQISATNGTQLKIIEQALFTLSLDSSSPAQLIDTSKMLLHGDGQDRYFDKSLQFIVFKNGKTGVNFEHTGMDGSVMLRLITHIYDNIDKYPRDKVQHAELKATKLTFQLNEKLHTRLEAASKTFATAISDTQTRIINFTQFGKNRIKTFKVSPDAFIQIALQLAEYKHYGRCSSAYEAIMTRSFSQGRIDVLYTVSSESKAFIEQFENQHIDKQTKITLLRKAAQKHITRAAECRQGMGVHTHFLALINRFNQQGKQLNINTMPALFSDKGYQTLTHNIICTSTTTDYGVEIAGYGPVVEDGYGIRYFNRADSICFNITSRRQNQDNLDLMVQYIEHALTEMALLMADS